MTTNGSIPLSSLARSALPLLLSALLVHCSTANDAGTPESSIGGGSTTSSSSGTGSGRGSTGTNSITTGGHSAGLGSTGAAVSSSTGGAVSSSTGGVGSSDGGHAEAGAREDGGGTGGVSGGGDGGAVGRDGGSSGDGGTGGTTAAREAGASEAGLGGASLCAPGKYLLCENFESAAVGAIPAGWTRTGTVSVSDDAAARGAHALKIGMADSGPRRISTSAASFGSAHWGRIFYKVQGPPPLPAANGVVHSTLVALATAQSEYRTVDTVENSAGSHQFLFNIQPNGNEWGCGSPYSWKYDGNWHCAEWNIDGKDQSYHFYLDGAEVTSIGFDAGTPPRGCTMPTPAIPMSFNQLEVGWYNYQTVSPGFVAWIDEIAIDTSRIGCGN